MEKIITEIYRGIKEKTSSPFLRYFTISWIITNFKFIYIFFFQNDELFYKSHNILKIDYLKEHYFIIKKDCLKNEYLFGDILGIILIPLLSALFFVYLFPWFNRKILENYKKNKDNDEKILQKYKLNEIEREKERNLKRNEVLKIEKENREVEKEITNENNNLKEYIDEYNSFKNMEYYNIFNKIIELSNLKKSYYYSYKNRIGGYSRKKHIEEGIISKYISLGIIDLLDEGVIKLTNKGKIFSNYYISEKKLS